MKQEVRRLWTPTALREQSILNTIPCVFFEKMQFIGFVIFEEKV